MKTYLKKIIYGILRAEAKFLLSRFHPFIIMVTGSVGKTSTKDALATAFSAFSSVRKSEKSFNSDIGVPLTILGLQNAWSNLFLWIWNIKLGLLKAIFSRKYPKILVLEVGADHPGDLREILSWVAPDACVVTLFPDNPPHAEYYESREELYAEESLPAFAVKKEGFVLLNIDDERVRALKGDVRGEVIFYGTTPPALFRIIGEEIRYEVKVGNKFPVGSSFSFDFGEEKTKTIFLPGVLGFQHAYPLSAALAAVSAFEFDPEEAAKALEKHVPPKGRMNIIEAIKGATLIDDTYNSSPSALTEAFATLRRVECTGRRIAVLGDMLELGVVSADAHKKAGREAADACEIVLAVGERAKGMVEGALEGGMSEKNIFHFDNSSAAGKFLETLISLGDLVLIKGSQGMRMERVVEEVMLHPENAKRLLARQEKEWKGR